ncbi:flagellin [Neptuniibacter halophilus]|uniref:flagellin n=1 Tax=Neptuniibacter halophilus TaxID=651666 RepID=UPI0025739F5B|nr:flagellin [Neptuniibacter halophilus]
MPINPTGVSSSQSYSLFNQVRNRIEENEKQLISGQRINNAAVDPAGLQVLINLQSDILSNSSAIRNSMDGISALQIADGGVNQVNDSLQRIRELSVQAQNGILNDSDRAALQKEADALLSGISDTLSQSQFNNQSLLSEEGSVRLQTGSSADDGQDIQRFNVAGELGDLGLLSLNISDPGALDIIDQSQSYLSTVSGEIGASQSRLESGINRLTESNLSQAESASRIGDTDYAKALSERSAAQIQEQAGIAVQAQANANRGLVLSLLGS